MKTKKHFLSLVLLLSVALFAKGEIPPHYYDAAEGTSNATLKTSLYQIIHNATVLKYGGSGNGYTWAGFYQTDRLTDNQVLDRYSTLNYYFTDNTSVSGMHIEHSFANSWWGHTKNQAYKDLHHLYPSDGISNIHKNNNVIGVVTEEDPYDNGVIKVGKSTSRPNGEITVWEPADEYKGDFARTYMYMVTCYEDMADEWQGEGLLLVDNNTYPVFEDWAIQLLLQWNENDPVDQLERDRNDAVYAIQGNRNPFIDYPDMANHIWGVDKNNAFYSEDNEAPKLFFPADQSTIDLGYQALSVPSQYTMTVRGTQLTTPITITSSNTVFTLSSTTVSPEEAITGKEITITGDWTAAGEVQSTITITSTEVNHTVTIKANVWDGIPAHEATNITCDVYSKKFTAHWMQMPNVDEVQLNVYTKEGDTPTSISGYPVTVSGIEHVVRVPAPKTTYYYTVTAGEMTSNEISVEMPEYQPIFSASPKTVNFVSVPNQASQSLEVTLQVLGVDNTDCTIVAGAPFEISTDDSNWSSSIDVTGSNSSFYARLSAVAESGDYNELITVTNAVISDPLVITATATVDASKAFFENFEAGGKTSYAEKDVDLLTGKWKLSEALIGKLTNDKRNDTYSLRMRNNSDGVHGYIEMLEDKTAGADVLSFYAGAYGSNAAGDLRVSYSTDQGANWTLVEGGSFTICKAWTKYEFQLGINAPIRIRIEKTDNSSSTTGRINIDDISITDYVGSGVSKVKDQLNYQIKTQPGALNLTFQVSGLYKLYSLQGTLIKQQNYSAGVHTILLPHGTYLVKIGTLSQVINL